MDEAILLYRSEEGHYETPLNSLQIRERCLYPVLVPAIPGSGQPIHLKSAIENCDGNYFDFCRSYSGNLSEALEANNVKMIFTFHPEKTIELVFHHGNRAWKTPCTNMVELFYPRTNIVTAQEREAFNLDMIEQLTNCHGNPEMATVLFTKLII